MEENILLKTKSNCNELMNIKKIIILNEFNNIALTSQIHK